MKLRNRQHAVPRGFRFLWAATGWDAQRAMPHRSFNDVVTELQRHVKANPMQASQSGMPSDVESLALLVEDYTAKQLVREGLADFVAPQAPEATFPKLMPPLLNQSKPANAVGAVSKTLAGVDVYLGWLGSGGVPVEKKLAELRANTCVRCPHNKPGDWKTWLTEKAAAGALAMIGMKNDLALETSRDESLNMCAVCLCPLKAKVWAPLEHVQKHLDPAVKNDLWSECWIVHEQGPALIK